MSPASLLRTSLLWTTCSPPCCFSPRPARARRSRGRPGQGRRGRVGLHPPDSVRHPVPDRRAISPPSARPSPTTSRAPPRWGAAAISTSTIPSGQLCNVTRDNGFGSAGVFQGAERHRGARPPASIGTAREALFSHGDRRTDSQQYQVLQTYWQLYEVTGLGAPAPPPTITKVANQPRGLQQS